MNLPPLDQYLPGEQFKPINFLHVPHVHNYYMVSTHGRVWSKVSCSFLKPDYDKDGYAKVGLTCSDGAVRHPFVHRLMLMVFDPQMGFRNLVCNHMDGNKQNNYMGNLEWTTVAGNTQHAYEHGLEKRGEDHSKAKISNETAMKIIEMLPKVGQPSPYCSCRQIAEIVGNGATEKMVSDIRRKISWKHMTKDIEFTDFTYYGGYPSKPARVFTDEDVIQLCNYFEANPKGDLSMREHSRNALMFIGKQPTEQLVDNTRKIYAKKYYSNITANRNFL